MDGYLLEDDLMNYLKQLHVLQQHMDIEKTICGGKMEENPSL